MWGAKVNFPRAEFEQRYAQLRGELARIDADALLVTGEASFNHFTGYIAAHPWVSFSRNLIALLPREQPPILIVPASLEREARAESWIEQIYLAEAIGETPIDTLAAAVRDLGLHNARIGAELGYEQRLGISLLDFQRLQESLPAAHFIDALPRSGLCECASHRPRSIACAKLAG